jgi:hypothetical protein
MTYPHRLTKGCGDVVESDRKITAAVNAEVFPTLIQADVLPWPSLDVFNNFLGGDRVEIASQAASRSRGAAMESPEIGFELCVLLVGHIQKADFLVYRSDLFFAYLEVTLNLRKLGL